MLRHKSVRPDAIKLNYLLMRAQQFFFAAKGGKQLNKKPKDAELDLCESITDQILLSAPLHCSESRRCCACMCVSM